MALQITKWDYFKIILSVIDFILIILNTGLFVLMSLSIYEEYFSRGTIKLYITPFVISIINEIFDLSMHQKNFRMRYAGHNRYGMLTRFFMFYFIMTIMIYSDQRRKYINDTIIDFYHNIILIIGFVNIGVLMISMIISFCVIDVESFRKKIVKRRKSRHISAEKIRTTVKNIEIPNVDS